MINDIEKIIIKIDDIRDNIYDYNLKDMFSNIDSLILKLSNCGSLKIIPKDKTSDFNAILDNINISLRNSDYQLLSDILKFQLKVFLENI